MTLFNLAKPVLHAMDAESAHALTIKALAAGFYPKHPTYDDAALEQNVFSIRFNNPVGMAAGFDKNADVLQALFALGFGFVEAGTVTPRPQAGNPRPRIFRDAHSKSVINRMGFPGPGAEPFYQNLSKFRAKNMGGIVGINIGKNKDTEDPASDYLTLVERMAPMADYITINISSPNTPGLRDLQKREFLKPFIEALKAKREAVCVGHKRPPLLVKFAPDLTDPQIDELSQTLVECAVDGIILSNTTLDRPDALPEGFRKQTGGLSGPYVRHKSTIAIRRFYQATRGTIPIIGVGGIASAQDAYAKICAGASLVQLYTALVFEGPALVKDIKSGLVECLRRDGYTSISQAIGSEHK